MKKIIFLSLLIFASINLHAKVSDSMEETGDTVKLKYAWHPGISIEIKYNHSESTSIPNQPDKNFKFNGNMLARTVPHEKGMQIDSHEIFFNFDENNEAQINNKMQQMMQELIGVSPSYVINPQGELVDVTKFEKFRSTIKNEMSKMFGDTPIEEQAKIQQFIEAVFSKEQLMIQLHDDWNRDVGQWLGAEFEQGYTYEVEFTRQVPMLGNIEVINKGTYEFLGRAACNTSDHDNSCVRLSYKSHVDEEASKPLLAALFKSMGVENSKELENLGIKIDYSLEVITEENTLLPHYVKETKITSTPNPQIGGLIKQQETNEYIYNYFKR